MKNDELPPSISEEYLLKWQRTINLIARIFDVPSGLITQLKPETTDVLVASEGRQNPFHPGDVIPRCLRFFCEGVVTKLEPINVVDATADAAWQHIEQLNTGMISYFGAPLLWPNGEVFGTLCAMDQRARDHSQTHKELLLEFRVIIESDLRSMVRFQRELTSGSEVRAELAQTASEKQLLLDNLPGIVACVSDSFTLISNNKSFAKQFHVGADSPGKFMGELIGKEGWALLKPWMERALSGERVNVDVCYPFPMGSRHLHMMYLPEQAESGKVRRVYILALDVHERKLAELSLKDYQERFHLMAAALTGGNWDWNLTTGEIFHDENWLKSFGYAQDESVRTVDFWRQIYHPDDHELVMRSLRDHMEGRTPLHRCEFRIKKKNGEYSWVLDVGLAVEWESDSKATRIIGIATDITERKRAEESLRHSLKDIRHHSEPTRTILNSISDGVIATDLDGMVMRMNPRAEELTGWTADAAFGHPFSEIFQRMDQTESTDAHPLIQELIQSASPGVVTSLRSRTGAKYSVAVSGVQILSETRDPQGYALVFRDVTEKRTLKEQLRVSEKMQAIGQLAGGIAHDFNNMLGGITSAAEVISQHCAASLDERSRQSLGMIFEITERAAELTSRLLTFSRKGSISTSIIDARQVLQDVVAILQRTLNRKTSIELDLKAACHTIIGDRATLQSAFLNLGINADHAMEDGGTLCIQTAIIHLDQAYCDSSPFQLLPGAFLEVTFCDNGCGIEPEILPQIFEPLFTTKGPGAGTGLGLATVYSTVQDHHGEITVKSAPHQGSTFRILIPCAKQELTIPTSDSAEAKKRGSGRILFVDDDDVIRVSGQYMLEELGYDVVTASSGAEAVALYTANRTSIDLVVMDLNMPGIDGIEAMKQIRDAAPESRIILSTGYANSALLEKLDQKQIAGILKKPYRLHEISTLISSVLQSYGDHI